MDTEAKNKEKVKKVSYYRQPSDMTIEEWQIALRRQFADKQNFSVRNIGEHPVFSDFKVYNPESGKEYKVAIRSYEFRENFCSCPDFKINELGTCKHIEFVLKQLKDNPANDLYWEKGFSRPYSSISLKYGKERKVFLRIGTTKAPEIKKLAGGFFDKNKYLLPGKFYEIIEFVTKVREYDPDFRIYHDALEFIIEERSKSRRAGIVEAVFNQGIDSPYFENLVEAKLYPYQKKGFYRLQKPAGLSLPMTWVWVKPFRLSPRQNSLHGNFKLATS